MTEQKKIIAFIPSRFASTRLPGKPLIDICGKTLIQRVWEGAAQSKILQRIIIPTDDERIAEHCFNIGAEAVMTSPDLMSGSDRILSAYSMVGEYADIIINIQGDEPLITGELIDQLIVQFLNSGAEVGTLIKKIKINDEIFEPSVVKALIDHDNYAVYFTRSPVPWMRDWDKSAWSESRLHYKHLGIYIYKKSALEQFGTLKPTKHELAEKLEQLRFLDNGIKIFCVETDKELIGVDTPQDLEEVRNYYIAK